MLHTSQYRNAWFRSEINVDGRLKLNIIFFTDLMFETIFDFKI
jgi:hypothetical protein